MPVVSVEMWEGRTVDEKKTLVEGITAAFGQIGIHAEAIHIIINDHPRHNWGMGGKLGSEIYPG